MGHSSGGIRTRPLEPCQTTSCRPSKYYRDQARAAGAPWDPMAPKLRKWYRPKMGRVQGKVAIVTGAASGLGAADAQRLAEEGAIVVLTDVDASRGKEVAGAIPNALFKQS